MENYNKEVFVMNLRNVNAAGKPETIQTTMEKKELSHSFQLTPC